MDTVLFGIKIIESPLLEPKPKLQLSPQCPCSDAMREEMNKYLLDTFGREPGRMFFLQSGEVVVPPGTKAALRQATQQGISAYLGGSHGR